MGIRKNDSWSIHERDFPIARKKDLEEIKLKISSIGIHLNYEEEGEQPITWTENGKSIIRFYPIASAIFGEIVHAAEEGIDNYVVLPGGRVSLALYKLSTNPHLEEQVKAKNSVYQV